MYYFSINIYTSIYTFPKISRLSGLSPLEVSPLNLQRGRKPGATSSIPGGCSLGNPFGRRGEFPTLGEIPRPLSTKSRSAEHPTELTLSAKSLKFVTLFADYILQIWPFTRSASHYLRDFADRVSSVGRSALLDLVDSGRGISPRVGNSPPGQRDSPGCNPPCNRRLPLAYIPSGGLEEKPPGGKSRSP